MKLNISVARGSARGEDGPTEEPLDESKDNETGKAVDRRQRDCDDDEEEKGRQVGDITSQTWNLGQWTEEEGAATLVAGWTVISLKSRVIAPLAVLTYPRT